MTAHRDRIEAVLRANGLTDRPDQYDGDIHSWRCRYPDQYGPCDCFAELLTDLAGVLPEATDFEEWGVRWPGGEVTSCGWMPEHSEAWARRSLSPNERIINGRIGEAVVRRVRTTYDDHVGDWIEVESDRIEEGT